MTFHDGTALYVTSKGMFTRISNGVTTEIPKTGPYTYCNEEAGIALNFNRKWYQKGYGGVWGSLDGEMTFFFNCNSSFDLSKAKERDEIVANAYVSLGEFPVFWRGCVIQHADNCAIVKRVGRFSCTVELRLPLRGVTLLDENGLPDWVSLSSPYFYKDTREMYITAQMRSLTIEVPTHVLSLTEETVDYGHTQRTSCRIPLKDPREWEQIEDAPLWRNLYTGKISTENQSVGSYCPNMPGNMAKLSIMEYDDGEIAVTVWGYDDTSSEVTVNDMETATEIFEMLRGSGTLDRYEIDEFLKSYVDNQQANWR